MRRSNATACIGINPHRARKLTVLWDRKLEEASITFGETTGFGTARQYFWTARQSQSAIILNLVNPRTKFPPIFQFALRCAGLAARRAPALRASRRGWSWRQESSTWLDQTARAPSVL